mmetsp:Transcript_22451/g.27436  ORF Transcript_22451/g.27436 Transcript_22451/m.27436 type:complete len:218 (+) Transcript_22451:664-1317(+)
MHTFVSSPPTASRAACSAASFPSKYPSKKSGNQFSWQALTSDATETSALRSTLPPRLALANAATFVSPFPRRNSSASVPTTPTHDTITSGLPMAVSNSSSLPSNKFAAFHLTSLVHASPLHHSGTRPDFETLVTDAPFSDKILHTREPTKPVPPTTVTGFPPSDMVSDDRGDIHAAASQEILIRQKTDGSHCIVDLIWLKVLNNTRVIDLMMFLSIM